MPNYRYGITFEYKDVGKNIANVRQRVAAAQKKAAQTAAGIPAAGMNAGVIKRLDNTFQKLIQSNKNLETTIKSTSGISPAGTTPGGRTPGFRPGLGGGGRAGFGGIGASIPIAGAPIALTGFVVKKMQQITDAYISKVLEQKETAGLGGFRTGAIGTYLGAERSAARKAYAMATGRFDAPKISTVEAQYGGVFGLGAPEVRRQAGIFARAGADYGQTVTQALGVGVETELPILMRGIADELEEAVKKGINTSDMAQDLGKEISSITMRTETKNVDAALNIIRSFKSVKEAVGRGKIGGIEQLYTRQATQDLLMERLKDPAYLLRLRKTESISKRQYEKLAEFQGRGDYGELRKIMGTGTTEYLTQKVAREARSTEILKQKFKNIRKQWGSGIEGMQRAQVFAAQQGWSLSPEQFITMYKEAEGETKKTTPIATPEYGTAVGAMLPTGGAVAKTIPIKSPEERGGAILEEQYRGVGKIVTATMKAGAKERLQTGVAATKIAGQTIKVETELLNMVNKFSGKAATGIENISSLLTSIDNKLEMLRKAEGIGETLKVLNSILSGAPKITTTGKAWGGP
jgi:hypothetical protein